MRPPLTMMTFARKHNSSLFKASCGKNDFFFRKQQKKNFKTDGTVTKTHNS